MMSLLGGGHVFVSEVGGKGDGSNAETGEHGGDTSSAREQRMVAPGVVLCPRVLEVGHLFDLVCVWVRREEGDEDEEERGRTRSTKISETENRWAGVRTTSPKVYDRETKYFIHHFGPKLNLFFFLFRVAAHLEES